MISTGSFGSNEQINSTRPGSRDTGQLIGSIGSEIARSCDPGNRWRATSCIMRWWTMTARALRKRPRLGTLHDAVFERPRIARYVASGRRLPFNNEDLFRHYPALDR